MLNDHIASTPTPTCLFSYWPPTTLAGCYPASKRLEDSFLWEANKFKKKYWIICTLRISYKWSMPFNKWPPVTSVVTSTTHRLKVANWLYSTSLFNRRRQSRITRLLSKVSQHVIQKPKEMKRWRIWKETEGGRKKKSTYFWHTQKYVINNLREIKIFCLRKKWLY